MNKKGNIIAILFIVGALFLLLFLGFMMAIGSSVINLVMDTAVPELTSLGVVGDFNASHAVEATITPVNTVIQNFTWLAGVVYIFGMIGVFGLAFTFRETGDKWLMGFFVALVLILVIGCIIMSNIYEEFYSGTDDIALRLKEHTLLSFMILYSPAIMGLIAFLSGIILFSGDSGGRI